MTHQSKNKIASMLTDAYHHLGINNVRELERRTGEALEYMAADREHYIEVAHQDIPEYRITTKNGVICKLIPLSCQRNRKQEKDHMREEVTVFSLMHTQEENRYVSCRVYNKWYNNPAENKFSYPVYRYIQLEDIGKTLPVLPPQQIRPAATKTEWETYGMMFEAFAKLSQNPDINTIPHKTERAMLTAAYANPKELVVDGKPYRGKVIPLAREEYMDEQLMEDHKYSSMKELCLLITETKSYYIMKTYHIYSYFSKDKIDGAPGGADCISTREKQEITYHFTALSDIQQNLYPFFY